MYYKVHNKSDTYRVSRKNDVKPAMRCKFDDRKSYMGISRLFSHILGRLRCCLR